MRHEIEEMGLLKLPKGPEDNCGVTDGGDSILVIHIGDKRREFHSYDGCQNKLLDRVSTFKNQVDGVLNTDRWIKGGGLEDGMLIISDPANGKPKTYELEGKKWKVKSESPSN